MADEVEKYQVASRVVAYPLAEVDLKEHLLEVDRI